MTADLTRVFRFVLRVFENEPAAKAQAIAALGSGLASGLVSAALVATINHALAQVADPRPSLVWRFAALVLLLPVARFTAEAFMLRLTAHAICRLRLSLSERVLGNSLARLEELGSPRIYAALTSDVQAIAMATAIAPTLLMNVALVGGCLVYLGWLSWKLLLLVLVVAVTGVVAYRIAFGSAYDYFVQRRSTQDQLFEHFRGLTDGFKELKLNRLRRQAFVDRQLGPTARQLRFLGLRGGVVFAGANSLGTTLFYALIGVILLGLPHLAETDLEVLTGFALAILYIMVPIDFTLQSLPMLARASIAVEKITSVGLALDRPRRTEEGGPGERGNLDPITSWSTLELRGVTSVYSDRDGHPFTLGPVDRVFESGKIIFLVGGNGSGKTTFAKILTGLYTPTAGKILLDGGVIDASRRDGYRQLFSAVFADFYLFQDLLGIDGTNLDRRAGQALEALDLAHKVEIRDGAFSTLGLSQGQRKRLALVVAYLEDRPIILFDEWAADQDPQFKRFFYFELLPELRKLGKTIFAITHDDAYFHLADEILRFDSGKVTAPAVAETINPTVVPAS